MLPAFLPNFWTQAQSPCTARAATGIAMGGCSGGCRSTASRWARYWSAKG